MWVLLSIHFPLGVWRWVTPAKSLGTGCLVGFPGAAFRRLPQLALGEVAGRVLETVSGLPDPSVYFSL